MTLIWQGWETGPLDQHSTVSTELHANHACGYMQEIDDLQS